MNDRTGPVRRVLAAGLMLVVWLMLPATAKSDASDLDEFRVKREAVFEFAERPTLTRTGDRIRIRFATKGFCDVTVAIERTDGRIVRHLASGVLGPKAPAPFQTDTKQQTLVWDGKDDQGNYVDRLADLQARVSLGLKPQFERTLFWSPHKPAVQYSLTLLKATSEGIYVHEGCGVDSVRLFDHAGDYVRTVYPFPASKVNEVQGLRWAVFPQDGRRLPLRPGFLRSTFLPSGTSADLSKLARGGRAATALAVWTHRIALVMNAVGRLSTSGTSGGLPLRGASVTFEGALGTYFNFTGKRAWPIPPRSAAFSPDGKYVYLTGYLWCNRTALGGLGWAWFHGVVRVPYAEDGPVTVFAGDMTEKGDGTDETHLRCPSSVATDGLGRVYVADYVNNRLQVFAPEGAFLKTIPIKRPAKVEIDPKTGEIYVFSWMLANRWVPDDERVPAMFTRLGGFDDPKVLASMPIPLRGYAATSSWTHTGGLVYDATVDVWTDPPTIWLTPGLGKPVQMLVERDGRLTVRRDFAHDVARRVVRAVPPVLQRQRLYVNPVNGALYVGEGDSGVMKSMMQLVRIDPSSGAVNLVELPFAAEDLAIDLSGLFYLRTDLVVVRYHPETWKEVPFDYGEERPSVGFDPNSSGRKTAAVSALVLPASGRPVWWHGGGMAVNARGHLAVTCYNLHADPDRRSLNEIKLRYDQRAPKQKPYTPTLFPGRVRFGELHIWDERGRILFRDAVPGLTITDGIGLDKNDCLYVMTNANRVLDDKPYFIPTGETIVKVAPTSGKVLSTSARAGVRLPRGAAPTRPPDLTGAADTASAWIEGAQWFYGGVGFGVKGDCVCWNARFALDLFARSFAPELDHFSIAVLDTNGNLITRIGRYGNVDDGVPLIERDGPSKPRSIGGDEVALAYAAYVATHTDHRLFIADAGNARIVSVRLDYHAVERVSLADAADRDP